MSDHALIVAIIISMVIFLVCRELVCWYWKINRANDSLEQILMELKKLNLNSVPKPSPLNDTETK